MAIRFRWSPEKDATNRARHGVAFDEAASVFADPLARIFADEDHSEAEHRELLVGTSRRGRLLIVSFTERPDGLRIISARQLTRRERHDYEEDTQR